MADQEVSASLKSQNSDNPTYVNFINNSRQDARAWWINFSGDPVSYGDIPRGSTMKMNTFLSEYNVANSFRLARRTLQLCFNFSRKI